jgi:very-short-patch-repair endonuclease
MQAPQATVRRARQLRREMTPPEARLWMALRRQHPIGPFVLDFYCDGAKLAVEVDGFAHVTGDGPQRDVRRDDWLAARGVRTLRIDARDVRDELDGVVGLIVSVAKSTYV